ncbi:MAG: hypothetical protein JNJ57_21845 [Saprospiraceae bacterium]|nr:hypothetical protein [Saprospiraceae bacterium]
MSPKITLTLFLLLCSFFSTAQDMLEASFDTANAEMRVRNLYHMIAWHMNSLNDYQFDQKEGYVTYTIIDTENEVKAVPKVLGTFNLQDTTFLWADKNSSIRPSLSDQVNAFRAQLPQQYRQDLFKSTIDFNKNLLALFCTNLNANGFDIKRQGNTIIYFALMQIDIYEAGKKTKTLPPNNHVTILENDAAINTIKAYHREKVEINRQHFMEQLSMDEGFKRMNDVNAKYWLNDNGSTALSWPCELDEKSTAHWQVFKLADENRFFVTFSADLRHTIEQYAYEIDINAAGKKIILGAY